MKKLFFTALVAVVAVGGAYAETINLYNENSTTVQYTCQDDAVTACESIPGTFYEFNSSIEIDPADYADLLYN